MSESITADSAATRESARPSLGSRVPRGGTRDPAEILDRFLGWVSDLGLEPFPHQEEALLELMAGRHLVLNTPTGSGKSLVALGLHFKGLCEGQRSFYTSPTKALASEKFFALCEDLGAANVGMLTGDASINPDAPVICCTAEVLSNMCLRQGGQTPAPYVVMDEFHFYSDRERGAAWQIPLLSLPHTTFLLMSATLGNTARIEERLHAQSGCEVAHVFSDERPVPLEFEYRETPLHETLNELLARERAPIYVVSFTQRECAERAQGLTSARLVTAEERRLIAAAVDGFHFDTPYGKEFRRVVRAGIGVHHAGLLPKYRLLVEQLSQRGLLKVICGTDTLGVGVNIPIRTVVFSTLCKFDGEKVSILSVREFKQISGRAGRKGFDERGSVVVQAPEHVIENKRRAARADSGPAKHKPAKRRPPPRGFVPWNRDTLERLMTRPPEMLASRFEVDHGALVNVLQREEGGGVRGARYRALVELIDRCHEGDGSKARLRRRAAALFRSLRRAGLVEIARDPRTGDPEPQVRAELQVDFSLHHTLSLFLLEAVGALDPETQTYGMQVLSLVESILENPRAILGRQIERRRRDLLTQLKARGVPYEERLRQLENVSYPEPEADLIRGAFRSFSATHPWVREENIRPKSIAREMFEECASFVGYVREYGLARSEGLLLRYLSDVHNTLVQTVPEPARSESVYDAIAFLRTMLSRVDTSLVEAWETLFRPEAAAHAPGSEERVPFDLARHERALAARVRSELHALVRALAAGEFAEAVACVRQDPDDPWDEARFVRELAPFTEEYERIVFTPEARQAHRTHLKRSGPRTWDVFQVIVDPRGDDLWAVEGEVDLRRQRDPEGPLVRLRRIGP